jgi:hypothetical protein
MKGHLMSDELRTNRKNNPILLSVLAVILLFLIIFNLWAATVLSESCGVVHPILFEIDIDYIDEADDRVSIIKADLPATAQPDVPREEIPHEWESCLQYWGHADNNGFRLNAYGINELAYDALEEYDDDAMPIAENLPSGIVLSETGTVFLYLVLPSLVLLMPIATLSAIRKDSTLLWITMGGLAAAQALTSALLYIHFSDVSGITALAEFGYSIFGGTTTGTAIAFMGKMLDIFREN